jgi:hypothetical protein
MTGGNFIWGPTLKGALCNLKEFYPDPEKTLREAYALEMAAF